MTIKMNIIPDGWHPIGHDDMIMRDYESVAQNGATAQLIDMITQLCNRDGVTLHNDAGAVLISYQEPDGEVIQLPLRYDKRVLNAAIEKRLLHLDGEVSRDSSPNVSATLAGISLVNVCRHWLGWTLYPLPEEMKQAA